MWPRTRLKTISCTSTTSGNVLPMDLSFSSSSRSWRMASLVSMVAGSLSMCVEYGGDLRNVGADIGLQCGDAVVGGDQLHGLVEFDVQFDVDVAFEILHADVMHREIVAQRGGADAIKGVLRDPMRGERR